MRHIVTSASWRRQALLIAFLTITLFVSGCVSNVFAQDATTYPTGTRREQVQDRRSAMRDNTQELREQHASKAAERREAIRVRLAEHRELMASKAAELRQRLSQFRDQRKAKIVERINSTLNMINEKRTETMRKHLERMSEILDKLQDRVENKVAQGKDGTAANDAIASASAAIASASAAVDAQSIKDYTIEVSSESGVKADAKEARDQLHEDLQAVRKLVVDAKQAVANAIRTAATTLGGIGQGSNEATGAGNQ